ncbi:hypothetical protein A2U01_0074664, partial [Trifolium medium]|nr:hypothetical protein [Trifolium medium]
MKSVKDVVVLGSNPSIPKNYRSKNSSLSISSAAACSALRLA